MPDYIDFCLFSLSLFFLVLLTYSCLLPAVSHNFSKAPFEILHLFSTTSSQFYSSYSSQTLGPYLFA